MPLETLELRLSFRKLLIGLVLVIVPVSIASLYSISRSHTLLVESTGTHFKAIAEATASEISNYIHDRVMSVGTLAAEPTIIEAAAAANRGFGGLSEAAINERIAKIEKGWNTPATEALVKQILAAPASNLLRRFREIDSRFLRVTATDARGAVIAGTHKTLDYYQADEEFWQAIYAQGRGSINITDVLYDEVTKSTYIGIGVAVLEPGSNRFIGAIDALVDISSIFPIVDRPQIAAAANTMLVKDDGTVIVARAASLSMRLKSEEYSAVHDAMSTLQGRQTGYLITDVKHAGRSLIGFADTGLKDDYQNLAWVVLVAQNEQVALAPLRTIERLVAFMALLGLTMVTLFAVYFSLHRARTVSEIEGVAHPEQATASRLTKSA